MADYSAALTIGGTTVVFPAMPPKISVKSPGRNETVTVLELGAILLAKLVPRSQRPLCDKPVHRQPDFVHQGYGARP